MLPWSALRRRFGDSVAPGCAALGWLFPGRDSHGADARARRRLVQRGSALRGGLRRGGKELRARVRRKGEDGASCSAVRNRIVRRSLVFEKEIPLRGAGIEVRTVYSGAHTHNLNGETVSTLRKAWPWLVQDDARWSTYLRDRVDEEKLESTD